MKVAVLGNGPSRVAYSAGDYDYVIGCNIPWAPVDAVVIVDVCVVNKIFAKPELLPDATRIFISTRAEAAFKKKTSNERNRAIMDSVLSRCDRRFEIKHEWHSSGHCAAMTAINLGATELYLFGFDSVFDNTLASYTNEFIKSVMPLKDRRRLSKWRAFWRKIIQENPSVKFNFVRGVDDYISTVPEDLS